MESKASQFAAGDIVPRLPVQQSINFRESPRSDDLLLETVLSNMSQGVLMFDADRRLLFYNQRYAEMYGLQRNFAKLGCALRDVLAQCMQAGLLAAEVEQYVARLDESLAERRMREEIGRLPDGVYAFTDYIDGLGEDPAPIVFRSKCSRMFRICPTWTPPELGGGKPMISWPRYVVRMGSRSLGR